MRFLGPVAFDLTEQHVDATQQREVHRTQIGVHMIHLGQVPIEKNIKYERMRSVNALDRGHVSFVAANDLTQHQS
jgi:hypothetical protein